METEQYTINGYQIKEEMKDEVTSIFPKVSKELRKNGFQTDFIKST